MASSNAPIGPIPEGKDPEVFDHQRRRLFWALTNGLYLVGSMADGRRNLMTASWVTQVASEPKMLGVAVESTALTHGLIEGSGLFTLSLVHRDERAVVRKFVKPCVDDRGQMTLNGVAYLDTPGAGLPVLGSALGFFECRVDQSVHNQSHTFFIGEVIDVNLGAQLLAEEDVEVLGMHDTRMNYGG